MDKFPDIKLSTPTRINRIISTSDFDKNPKKYICGTTEMINGEEFIITEVDIKPMNGEVIVTYTNNEEYIKKNTVQVKDAWQLFYKCRACDTIIPASGEPYENKDDAYEILGRAVSQEVLGLELFEKTGSNISMIIKHNCSEDNLGVADLCGVRKIEIHKEYSSKEEFNNDNVQKLIDYIKKLIEGTANSAFHGNVLGSSTKEQVIEFIRDMLHKKITPIAKDNFSISNSIWNHIKIDIIPDIHKDGCYSIHFEAITDEGAALITYLKFMSELD